MRTLLLLIVTVAFVASNGCGEGKSQKVARSNAPSASGERKRPPKPQGPGIDKSADKKDDEKADSKEGDEKGEAKEKKKAPPKKRTSWRGRRPPKPSAGGGPKGGSDGDIPTVEDDKKDAKKDDKKRDEEKKEEEPEEDKFVSFLDRAHKAFEKGHEPEAFQYVYAHVLAEDDALRQYPMGWYKGINEPRVGLRWGVGISYDPGSFEGDPPTIGNTVIEDDRKSKGKRKSGGGGNDFNIGGGDGGGGMSMSGRGNRNRKSSSTNNRRNSRNADSKPPMELLTYYTGEFGEKLVERYEMRRQHNDAFYGEVLKTVGEKSSDPEEKKEPEKKEKKKSTSSNDDFVIAGSGSNLSPGGRRADNDNDEDAEYEAEKTGLAPGLMMLGTGSKDEMLKKAKAMNLDVLAFFIVKVKHSERRNGDTSTKSMTELHVYTVKNGDLLVETKNLSDISVAKARQSKRSTDDPVEKELDKVFREKADSAYKAAEMPTKYEAKVFKKRFDFLMEKDYDNPLPVLVEMKNYVDLGYISDNDYRSALEKYLGETETIDLLDGDMKKRELALRKFLPGQFDFEVEVSDADDFR